MASKCRRVDEAVGQRDRMTASGGSHTPRHWACEPDINARSTLNNQLARPPTRCGKPRVGSERVGHHQQGFDSLLERLRVARARI